MLPHLRRGLGLMHFGFSSFGMPAEPVSISMNGRPGSPLSRLRPQRMIYARRLLLHTTLGVPTPVAGDGSHPGRPELIQLLSGLDRGAILVNAQHEVLFANSEAERLLDGLIGSTVNGQRTTRGELRATMSRLSGATSEPMALNRRGHRPLLVLGIPLGQHQPEGHPNPMLGTTLALLTDPEADDEPQAAVSLQLLGLTPAEARAATLVGSGLTPKEVAEMLGNSEGTVRIHLRHVYQKLDISKQTELAAMVARMGRLGL